MSPVEPESSSSAENQAKPNTIRKKKKNGSFRSHQELWRGESVALLSSRVLQPVLRKSRLLCGFISCANLSQKGNLALVGFLFLCLLPLTVWGSGVCRMEDRRSYCALLGVGDQMSFNLLSICLSPYYTQSPFKMFFKSTCGSLYQDYNTRSIPLNNSSGTLQQCLACGSILKLYGEKKGENTT